MKKLLSCCLLMYFFSVFAQHDIPPPDPVLPVPTQRQLDWMSMEMNAFIHFTTNTFTDLEWGLGDEAESVFNPTAANPDQWVQVLKNAGFKGLILTCKHHDGFCLWPSSITEHSIKNSAVYAMPGYVEYYRNQLTELFSNYGPIFELWFDGANGGTGYYGGANENRQISQDYYDWEHTIKLARSLQNEELIIFSDAGPDIRWVGNEQGYVCETNWYAIDPDSCHIRRPGFEKIIGTGMENGSDWIPSEVDVSIRPGWFYHASEDSLVKSPERLFEIYLESVGRGAVLLLNVPPDRRGLIHENDIKSLQGFRQILNNAFKTNLINGAKVSVSTIRGNAKTFDSNQLIDNNQDTYWATDDSITTGSIEIDLFEEQTVNYVVLHEYLNLGQRVKAFTIEIKKADGWIRVAEATTMGFKRIIKIEPVTTNLIRVNFTEAKACLTVSGIEVY